MGKFKILIFLVFFLLVFKINAQDLRFGWNLGSINIYRDILNNEINGDCSFLHFNWIINKFSIGINMLDIYDFRKETTAKTSQYSVLPVKIAYVPLNYNDWLYLSIYGKAGWQLTKNDDNINHGVYSSVGLQFYIFPEGKLYYSPSVSMFFEYDTHNKLKIGFSLELGVIIYLFGLFLIN